jgi:transcription elongation factor Elf1
MTARTVELHVAYVFTCEDCGRDSFVRSTVLEPGSVNIDDFPDNEEIRDWIEAVGTGNFCTIPTEVTCSHCGTKFDTEDPRTDP